MCFIWYSGDVPMLYIKIMWKHSIKKVSIFFPEKKEEALEKIGGTNLPMTIGIGVAHFIIVFIVLVMGI